MRFPFALHKRCETMGIAPCPSRIAPAVRCFALGLPPVASRLICSLTSLPTCSDRLHSVHIGLSVCRSARLSTHPAPCHLSTSRRARLACSTPTICFRIFLYIIRRLMKPKMMPRERRANGSAGLATKGSAGAAERARCCGAAPGCAKSRSQRRERVSVTTCLQNEKNPAKLGQRRNWSMNSTAETC